MTSAQTPGRVRRFRAVVPPLRSSRRNGRQALRTAGRAGFAARGVIYLLIGYLALRIAFGQGGEADRQGALRHVASGPFGTVALWLLAAGFACMALWRASLALARPRSREKTAGRVGHAARAVFYASVCAATAAYAAGSGGGSSSDQTSRDWTATVMKLPGGRLVAGAAGVVVIVAGLAVAVRALRGAFLKKLDTGAMSRRTRQVVTVLGTGGNVSRGVIYCGVGVFVLTAAIRFDPDRAKGMDDTLRAFAHTAAGPWLLVAVAVGLVLFGGFSFACARWRRL